MRLKELRKENKKTQEEIAKYLDTSQMNYNRYENGKAEPTIKTLCKLADYYNVSLDYLIGRKSDDDFENSILAKKQDLLINKIKNMNYIQCVKLNGYADRLTDELAEIKKGD